jgi:D-alanine transaminase
MDALGYYNGKWGPLDEMTVPMNDRGGYFGDGIYEAALAYNGVIFTLDEHINRLFNSAKLLMIEIAHTKDELKNILNEMLGKLDKGAFIVYWQVTRGSGRRNHVFPGGPSNLWIMIKPQEIVDLSRKVKLITVEDTRFLLCNIKTINLIPNILAAEKAKNAGCDEAIFHRGEIVTECSHSNVHIIKNGTLVTHPLNNLILPGITRSHLASICIKLGIPVDEREYTLTELFDADEVLITSTGAMCLPAETVDGKKAGGKAMELVKKIQDYMMGEFCEATGFSRL